MNFYDEEIKKLVQKDNFRQIHNIEEKYDKYLTVNGQKMINFSSNDYLNLSTNRTLIDNFLTKYKNTNEFIFSSASSRLLTGTSRVYKQLENKVVKVLKVEGHIQAENTIQENLDFYEKTFNK